MSTASAAAASMVSKMSTAPMATAAAATEAASNVFRSLARSRRSARRFAPRRRIPSSTLRDILLTTRTSPSGFNLQPTHTILLRDEDLKHRLADEAMLGAGNAHRARDCSAMAVFLSDREVTNGRIDRICQLEKDAGMRDPNYLAVLPVAASFLTGEGQVATALKQAAADVLSPVQPMPSIESVEAWGCKNAGIGATVYTLAAHSHGLATCMMEGYDMRRAREILRVPDRYHMPIMVATGYPYEEEGYDEKAMEPTPRLEMEELFFGDAFGQALALDDDLATETADGDEL